MGAILREKVTHIDTQECYDISLWLGLLVCVVCYLEPYLSRELFYLFVLEYAVVCFGIRSW